MPIFAFAELPTPTFPKFTDDGLATAVLAPEPARLTGIGTQVPPPTGHSLSVSVPLEGPTSIGV
jgi:hypothetical protein